MAMSSIIIIIIIYPVQSVALFGLLKDDWLGSG